MPELKGRRERFCREYLIDMNATQAYVRAGYTSEYPGIQCSKLMAEPEIHERIAELSAARLKAVDLEANDIIVELLRMLTSDPLNYVNDDGSVKALVDIPLDARRAVASFEVDTVGTTGAVIRTKVKFWSKEKAAELLGKHLTLFKDVLNVEGLDDLAKLIIEGRHRVPRVIEHEPARIEQRAQQLRDDMEHDLLYKSPEELV